MVERYSMSIQGPFDRDPPGLEPDNDGDWVRYSDYATLAKRLEEAEAVMVRICKQDRVTRFRGTEQQFYEDGPCGQIARRWLEGK